MSNMSNLPTDLVEEILSRIPLTSLRAVRSTCKKWNSLFKDKCFTKKHLLAQEAASRERGEFMAIALVNYDLFLMSFDLRGIYNNDISPFENRKAKLISLDDAYQVDILRVFNCDGLLLCTTSDYRRLIVWNPYTGQTRWVSVEPTAFGHQKEWYYLGYDKSKSRRAHKILRLVNPSPIWERVENSVQEIFDLNSNSWRVLDVIPDCWMNFNSHSLSLKGNTYWYGLPQNFPYHKLLVCFDFTTELFGPHLLLPFTAGSDDVVFLSSLREEKIVVLFQRKYHEYEMEIWVSTNIEQEVAVSWSKFFAIDMTPITGYPFLAGGNFIIDEEKRAVIVFDKGYTSSIIGENGYTLYVLPSSHLGEIRWESHNFWRPFVCSYVPSSAQINQPA